jgi:hypothetical protein
LAFTTPVCYSFDGAQIRARSSGDESAKLEATMPQLKRHSWFDYANLGISALTPLVTGVFAVLVLYVGVRVDQSKELNQTLLTKRLEVYENIAPKLNDIYCFYEVFGNWADLNPDDIIKRKRDIDNQYYVYKFLFSSAVTDAYPKFEAAFFHTYSGPGQPLQLMLDLNHVRSNMGNKFNADWEKSVSNPGGNYQTQTIVFENLLTLLASDVEGGSEAKH